MLQKGQNKRKIDKSKEELFKRWKEIKNKNDQKSKNELEEIEQKLADKYAEDNFRKISDKTANMNAEDGGINPGSLWNLKREMFPKSREPLTAMKDPLSGNLLTTHDKINEAAINVYSERLKNRPMKNTLQHIRVAKEKLCEKVLKVAKRNVTPDWTMKDLEAVLKHLKKQKSRDPLGLANDIFRPEVAGDDLKEAVLRIMNKIKAEQCYPKCLEPCNISSIWKRKSSRNDFNFYRGIFRVTIFRSILDRLIYNDEIDNIDKSLTDSNVGARRNRNIRDNIFAMNAILNSVSKENKEALDLQIYDIEKCFDSLWLHEVINCLFEAGLRNDKLPLLFLENANAQIAVKGNGLLSKRINIKNIIMQGSVWGSICCVVFNGQARQTILQQSRDFIFLQKSCWNSPATDGG